MFLRKKKEIIVIDYNIEKVFRALIKGAASISGFEISYVDEITHSIGINVKASLFTWGEHIYASLNDIGENKTEVIIKSESKIGLESLASAKNKRNVHKLIYAVYSFLK